MNSGQNNLTDQTGERKPAEKQAEKVEGKPVPAQLKRNFGALEDNYSGYNKAKVVVVPVPYEKTVTYKAGTGSGPQAIIDASMNMELFDEELNQETFRVGIHTAESLKVEDLPPEDMIEQVHVSVAEHLKAGKFPVVLGGEHTVSLGAVKAFAETTENFSVLHLDAHYDLKDVYHGSKYNHGCVARRMFEMAPIVQVGMRSLAKEEKDFLTASGDKIINVDVYRIAESMFWRDEILTSLKENVYVTIDLDVFDPSFMPAVGTPEPGGISWYETLEFLRSLVKYKKVIGFDVVELCPIKGSIASDFIAAKLIYRFLGYIYSSKK
ncbi:MAG: agmatinase [Candidatus Omnitrophota bacterium]